MEDGLTWSIDKMHRSPNAMQLGLTWSNQQMHWSPMEMEDRSTRSINKMNRSPNAMQVRLLMFGECQGHIISWSRLLGEEDLTAKGRNHDVIESSSYLGLQHA
eukprot:754990-Ditylum_brightwellii.AAC.1